MRASLLTAALAASSAALALLSPVAAHASTGYFGPGGSHRGAGDGGPGGSPGDYTDAGGLQPDQLVVCSHGAHSDAIVEDLTDPSTPPDPGGKLYTIPKDSCITIVSYDPSTQYPIDGTYHVSLQGFKERPLACEDVTHDPDCNLPFHHLEITHATRPGVTNIDQPEATVRINALDGVRVDFVYRGDYRHADQHTGDFDQQSPQAPPSGY